MITLGVDDVPMNVIHRFIHPASVLFVSSIRDLFPSDAACYQCCVPIGTRFMTFPVQGGTWICPVRDRTRVERQSNFELSPVRDDTNRAQTSIQTQNRGRLKNRDHVDASIMFAAPVTFKQIIRVVDLVFKTHSLSAVV